LGDSLKEGESLRWLSRLYWIDGRGAEAETAAMAALELLETLPPGPELAMAYSNLANLRMLADDLDETLRFGEQAIALAEQLEETETLVHALASVGTMRLYAGDQRGEDDLARSVRLAIDHGYLDHACRALSRLAFDAIAAMRLDEAERRLATAIAFATDYDLDAHRWFLQAGRAGIHFRRGEWNAAEAEARLILGQPAQMPVVRIVALAALGHLQARRGDAEARTLLDEALVLAEGAGTLTGRASVRAARAEAALLDGDQARAHAEASAVGGLTIARGDRWQRGEIAWLLWQAGDREVTRTFRFEDLAEPYALQIAGDFAAAAAAWQELGCPYEAACAQVESDDPALVRGAVTTFERLGAKPAIANAIWRLRALGVRDLPQVRRGPRASTRDNPAGLTRREAEVLALVADGLRNAEIAERLYLTPKTVSHHLSAIYAKLGVASRVEAARAASQLGIGAS
jgi:DNA-binding CsgD family transcriptional regulator